MLLKKLQSGLKKKSVKPVDNDSPIDNKLILEQVVTEVVSQYMGDIKEVVFEQVTKDFKTEVQAMVDLAVSRIERGAKGQDADERKITEHVLGILDKQVSKLESDVANKVVKLFPNEDKIISKVINSIPLPKDGKTPVYGKDFKVSKDQVSDTALEIAAKLNTEHEIVDMDVIRGLKATLTAIHNSAQGSSRYFGGGGSTAAGGFTLLPATGTVNGVNADFTFTEKPDYIVSDGAWYVENTGWTWSGLTATMSVPPNDGIYGFT